MTESSRDDVFDLDRLRVGKLAQRRSLLKLEDVLIDPDVAPRLCDDASIAVIERCAARIIAAREHQATVSLIYGAHLIRNGAGRLVQRLLERGWVTHLATNGAGSIHDWEFAYLGRTCEPVRENVAAGCFGTWDETARWIHLALLTGGLEEQGYGQSVGRLIWDEGLTLPTAEEVTRLLLAAPDCRLAPAWAEWLAAMPRFGLPGGRTALPHPGRHASPLAHAFRLGVPLTVHPGIGYDIIANHPLFSGGAIGRAAAIDFRRFVAATERLENGVVMCVGSAIMGPQVFEKSLSCVNNVRRRAGQAPVAGHSIFVVDLQEGGSWDWSRGEPPRTSPAYYLRFCKSFSRMGGQMEYLQCDNVTFLHHLWRCLKAAQA